jgi:hypothetical protein
MNEIINFIMENQEAVLGIIAIVISLVTLGRKRATKLVLKHLESAKEDFLKNIDSHAKVYAKYIYAKLPKTAKLFLTAKRIERIIIKVAEEIKTLDK